jgi:hypothetical protein
LVEDLIKNIPLVLDLDPEKILNFLIQAGEILELKLVTDLEFMSLVVSRTSGQIAQIIGHIGTTHNWGIGECDTREQAVRKQHTNQAKRPRGQKTAERRSEATETKTSKRAKQPAKYK